MIKAKNYLRAVSRHLNENAQNIKRSINPTKFYANQILNQIKSDEKISLRKKPNIVVEINNTCNLNCAMCGTKDAKRPKGTMPVDDFVWILDHVIKPKNQKMLVVHTVGEPLMHPQFDEIAEAVYRRNIQLLLTTNGLFLQKHRRIFEEYRNLFAGINISVDGASRETYDKIRIGANFDNLIENLKWLADIKNKLRLRMPVRIQSVLSADNLNEIPDYFKVYAAYVQPEDILFSMVSNLSAGSGKEGYYFSKNILERESVLNVPCKFPFIQMHILFDRRISACCRDYHGELIMGNIKKNNWNEVWHSEKYENLRSLHRLKKTGELPLCKSCFSVPSAFSFLLNNYIQYLVYTGRLEKKWLNEKIDNLFKDFSDLYHKKDYSLNKLTKILKTY